MKDARKHVVIGVTGSISAYKACELVRLCVREGFEVRVVMTEAAEKFVGELSFRTLSKNAVADDLFARTDNWKPVHIELAEWADVFVVAPATAQTIAKLANGFADNTLTCAALATKAPVVVAPGMNTNMLENAATQVNLAALAKRVATVLPTDSGELACGAKGSGRMLDPAKILAAVQKLMQ